MSGAWVSDVIRRLVRERARGLCEYCLLHEDGLPFTFHVDHVIAEKHGGLSLDHNLSYCCPDCNRAKGSDISTVVSGKLVRLFNPRIDEWKDHFALDGALIRARTRIGAGTIRLLGMNDGSRVQLRDVLLQAGSYPGPQARVS
jgi:5-methylcytosine-specific restriction endonuclease McrA